MRWSILVVFLLVGGCASPAPDPNNGVSDANYRRAIENSSVNLRGIVSRIEVLERDDLSLPHPRHSAEWWDAQIGLARDTLDLLDGTLAGASPKPQPPKVVPK